MRDAEVKLCLIIVDELRQLKPLSLASLCTAPRSAAIMAQAQLTRPKDEDWNDMFKGVSVKEVRCGILLLDAETPSPSFFLAIEESLDITVARSYHTRIAVVADIHSSS